jgi:hypothetical protein
VKIQNLPEELLKNHHVQAKSSESASSEEEGTEGEDAESSLGEREEREEEEEAEEFNNKDLVCAICLLSFVVFIMTLYYMVNIKDEDMKIYVWTVISTTISIFLSVFAFVSVQKALHEILTSPSDSDIKFMLLGFFQFAIWFILMEVSIFFCSGAYLDKPFSSNRRAIIHQEKLDMKILFKSVATLLAHITGFAAINFGGCLQQMYPFNNEFTRYMVPPIMFVLQIIGGRLVRIIRVHLKKQLHARPETDISDQKDPHGHNTYSALNEEVEATGDKEASDDIVFLHDQREWCMATWDEETYEAEVDVAGLSVSFLLVQACRASITGVMPNALGIEEEHYVHPQRCSVLLLGLGLAFSALCVTHVIILKCCFPDDLKVPPLTCQSFALRCVRINQNVCALAFAWSLYVASKWEITRYTPKTLEGDPSLSPNGVISRVLLAVEISFIAFFVTVCLDKLADMDATGPIADRAIITIIMAISMLVGFAYEQSFDGAVEALADMCFKENPIVAELVLTIGIWILVYPAWRWYILQKLLDLRDEHEHKDDDQVGIDDSVGMQ